ncbi:superoxide dismutase [Candidatus Woesearchaeota archaeon]|nr:superoxide dismutase [Candidatus Woesearchaeota archaeon]
MVYEAKSFDHLLGTAGFSDQLLKNHFTLYQGYVTNTNKLAEDLAVALKSGWLGTPGYAELKRRFGWEFNGMRLHELYFGNMKKGGSSLKQSKIMKQIEKDFGAFDNWEKDFRATGAMRGIGWVVLYYDNSSGKLFNVWINEHDVGHLSGCTPLLVMDVFEHAFMLDYGVKRVDYIEAFFKAIDWNAVEERF